MLEVAELAVTYKRTVRALRSVSLSVDQGGIAAVLGSNGAGKSTLMRAVSRTLSEYGGAVDGGSIVFDGQDITRGRSAAIVKRGLVQIPEGRGIFGRLTVEENLRAGGFGRSRADTAAGVGRALELFPELEPELRKRAALLSGGQQQMLAIGRALVGRPRLLLLDEPSLGLAPHVVARVAAAIEAINGDGTSVLLVEQNAAMALRLASTAFVMSLGETILSGSAAELEATDEVRRLYLGVDAEAESATEVDAEVRRTRGKVLARWAG